MAAKEACCFCGNKQTPVTFTDWDLAGRSFAAIIKSEKPRNLRMCKACGMAWTKWS